MFVVVIECYMRVRSTPDAGQENDVEMENSQIPSEPVEITLQAPNIMRKKK